MPLKLQKRKAIEIEDEEIPSDSDDEEIDSVKTDSDLTESSDDETAQEKKIRLAKSFIEQIEKQKEEESGEDDDSGYVSKRLEDDLNNKIGKLRKEIAQNLKSGTIEKQLKGHRLSVTCAVVSLDSKFIFSASKDGTIIKWNRESGLKENIIKKKIANRADSNQNGHSTEILCLALSSDFKFLASGGYDKSIKIWNPVDCSFVYSFEGHRDAVSGLVFRHNTRQLFSASFDRSVKVWNLEDMVYVETLFGHQDRILAIDSLSKERCLTCGARDRSIRLWKIVEESQLVFNGPHFDSIDCLCYVNEETFLSGSNDGSLAVWNISKKKPTATIKNAHKASDKEKTSDIPINNLTEPLSWISSVAALPNSDLVASGSDDGHIRLWSFANQKLNELFKIDVGGFVNSLKFNQDGSYLIASVGQEHRLGRWSSKKYAKNSVLVIKLNQSTTNGH